MLVINKQKFTINRVEKIFVIEKSLIACFLICLAESTTISATFFLHPENVVAMLISVFLIG